jgi:hypothetical protein
MTAIDQAIEKAGGREQLAALIGTTPQFITNSKRKGYLPLERAKIVADTYGIPLIELVRKDIADAMRR